MPSATISRRFVFHPKSLFMHLFHTILINNSHFSLQVFEMDKTFSLQDRNNIVCKRVECCPRHSAIFVVRLFTSFDLSRKIKREEKCFVHKTGVIYLSALLQIIFAVVITYRITREELSRRLQNTW